MPICGFLGENKKPDEKNIFKNGDSNDLLTLQMKYAINKINSQYVNKKNSIISPLCDYYCNYHIYNNNINIFNNDNNNTINNNEKKNKNNNKYNSIYYNKFSKYTSFKNYK